ncbi:MAG: restriction endonuclease subunit S [Bacteroidia bacterium]
MMVFAHFGVAPKRTVRSLHSKRNGNMEVKNEKYMGEITKSDAGMGWEMVKLSDVADVIAGQSPESKFYNDKGEGIPFFQGKADFRLDYPVVRYWCTQPTKIAKPKDILISVRAPVGPTNICDIEACIGRGLAAIRTGEELDYKYLYFYFKTIENKLASQGNGSTFSAITTSVIKDLQIPLPPLSTQKRIAEILDAADALRRKDQELLKKYDELAQAIFIDMFGDFSNKEQTKSLNELSEITNGVTKNEKLQYSEMIETPYLRVANVQDGYLDLSEIKNIKVKLSDFKKYQLKRSDILITEGGDPDKLGRGTTWQEEIPNCIFQNHLFRIRVTSEAIRPFYLAKLIGSKYGKKYFLKAAKQTTGIATINSSQLKSFPAIVPPIEKQLEYEKISLRLEIIKKNAVSNLFYSDSLFNSLLQKAFKGELVT